jgi:dienelactone hydrolase
MKAQVHKYDGGGVRSHGYLALPDKTGARPGVLVVHEAPGLDDHAKRRADMLAGLGYVALAADLYGGGVVGKGEQALKLMAPLRDDSDLLRRRMRAAFDELAKVSSVDNKKLAAIGYCFGGMSVLELARSGAPAAGVVSFHGLLKTQRPASAGEVKAKILVCTGSADPIVPAEQVVDFEKEMIKAGTDWQVITYGGAKHAFTNTPRTACRCPASAIRRPPTPAPGSRCRTFLARFSGRREKPTVPSS